MIRFPTEAANADVLGDDTPLAPEPEASPVRPPSADRPEHRRGRAGVPAGAGKPGQDIDAPGFIKDRDGRQPS